MANRKTNWRAAAAVLLSAGALLYAATPATALDHIRVTIPVLGMNFLPLLVAADKGYFAKEGIEAEVIVTSGDGPDVDALIAGSVNSRSLPPTASSPATSRASPCWRS